MLTEFIKVIKNTNEMDYFIGIDVSKLTLDVAVLTDGNLVFEQRIENRPLTIRSFLNEFIKANQLSADQLLVCMEHTGIYNAAVLEVFWKKGIRICLEPALRIKQSQGMVRGKNDRVDAYRIASYAFKNCKELTFWKPARHVIQKMQTLLSMRERLIRAKIMLEVPLRELVGFVESSLITDVATGSRSAINGIAKALKEVDKKLQELINQDPDIHKKVKQITSVPGVGQITAMNMIISTAEFTRITEAKKFACYAGIAPFEHSSGTSIRGKARVSKMANMTMKKLLHLAAMSAIQCDPELKTYYHRKVEAGKNKMNVINAVRNKLISRVFACINNDRPYQKDYQYDLA
jgi:transposase